MAPAPERGADEEGPLCRRANGRDLARGRQESGRGGCQEAQGQRADDLRVAAAIWVAAACGREALARVGGKRQAQVDGRRSRDVDRDVAGDQPPKMVSSQAEGTRWLWRWSEGIPSAKP